MEDLRVGTITGTDHNVVVQSLFISDNMSTGGIITHCMINKIYCFI